MVVGMNNPPAFPNPYYSVEFGMTLRDYFAAKAMQIMWDAYDKGYCGLNNNDAPNVEIIAAGSYSIADAMLKAREA
jgi:hypothetical protein